MPKVLRNLSGDRIVVDTLRLSDAQWYDCVSEMDRNSIQNSFPQELRRDERVPYRNSSYVMIEMLTYDGRQQYLQVRPYDLSRSGLGFLNGAYMHVGTEVVLHLRHRETGMTRLEATIRCCCHVKNKIHLVGAEFDEPIEIDDFLLAGAGGVGSLDRFS